MYFERTILVDEISLLACQAKFGVFDPFCDMRLYPRGQEELVSKGVLGTHAEPPINTSNERTFI